MSFFSWAWGGGKHVRGNVGVRGPAGGAHLVWDFGISQFCDFFGFAGLRDFSIFWVCDFSGFWGFWDFADFGFSAFWIGRCVAVWAFWLSGFLGSRVSGIFKSCGFHDFLVPRLWWLFVFCIFRFLDSGDILGFRCLALKIWRLLDARSTRRAELAKVSVASLELLSDLVYSGGLGKRFRRRNVAKYKGQKK